MIEKDILCMKLADSCYDLGYSLFSHKFEYVFKKNKNCKVPSLIMINVLLKYHRLKISNIIEDLNFSLL